MNCLFMELVPVVINVHWQVTCVLNTNKELIYNSYKSDRRPDYGTELSFRQQYCKNSHTVWLYVLT